MLTIGRSRSPESSDSSIRPYSRGGAFPAAPPGLTGGAEILWSDHQVPFVLAERDEDVLDELGFGRS